MAQEILSAFGLDESDLIGEGVESRVYALDAERVLRILKARKPEEMRERSSFLGLVGRGRYPYAVPQVIETGEISGGLYAIERRLAGTPLRHLLPNLSGSRRRQAVRNFLLAIDPLSTADVSGRPFGELTGRDQVRSASWKGFLRGRLDSVLPRTKEKLAVAVPGLNGALARFDDGLAELEDFSAGSLVHGDYYPAHVMMDADLTVTGLLDFSGLSIVGDPDIDRAEALATFEDPSREGATEEDADYARSILIEERGQGVIRKLHTYQLYYAQLFSGCEEYDPVTYAWCLRILRRASRSEG